ncbi:hypothetical protein J6590_002808 [Homalodisca vitripennis]|nr:hypothetical protein J6590_002808 [Homalodisca vitripennis]
MRQMILWQRSNVMNLSGNPLLPEAEVIYPVSHTPRSSHFRAQATFRARRSAEGGRRHRRPTPPYEHAVETKNDQRYGSCFKKCYEN